MLLMQATDEDFSVNCAEIELQCWWCLLVRGQSVAGVSNDLPGSSGAVLSWIFVR